MKTYALTVSWTFAFRDTGMIRFVVLLAIDGCLAY